MKNKNTLTARLSRSLLFRLISTLVLFIAGTLAVYLMAKIIFFWFPWSGDEFIYQLAVWANNREAWFSIPYFGIGIFLIIRHYWRMPFQYFQEIIDATKSVYDKDDQLVSLSAPLGELEGQLNQIKMAAAASERAAREAEQRKNDLVTYLAHDLKTPITSVIGYLTLLKDEPEISPKMQAHYIDIALDKAERLDELINEFFEITRFNLSHITLETRQIDLILMLQQLIYEFKPMLKDKNLTCTFDGPKTLLIRCDPDKLQRVFDNLLRNAVNYSFENSSIRICAVSEPSQVVLTFENDGNTISREKLDRIFEQFYRLDSARSSRSGGAGLGLAIAKEIVELHSGTIKAFSENDLIRFTVTLPL